MDSSYLNMLIDDNIELSEKVENLSKLDIDKITEEVFQKDDLAKLTEEKVTYLIETFNEIENFIKKINNDQESKIKDNKSRINEITEEIRAFDPSELDQESLENFSNLIKEKNTLQNEISKIRQKCDKRDNILTILNKAYSEINDRRIDIDNGKYSEEQQKIESELQNVEKKLADNEKKSNELSKKIGACNKEIEKIFEDLKKINSKEGVLSDEDQKKQKNIFEKLNQKVVEKKQYEEEKDSLAETIQELEDKKVDLEEKKVKNAKNLKKQEENEKHIENRISKFEELAEKENLTKIEMGIFKGIHDEIMYDPDIKDAEKKRLDEKYISNSSVLNATLDPSKIKVSNGIKKQKEVAKVSRIKSRVAKAKVSTLLFIQDKFDKAVNQWTGFKANSVEKKINKLEEKQRKIEEKRTELENMRASLQNLYTNNPILDQEDVSSARKM